MSLPFLRPDLTAFSAYSPHSEDGEAQSAVMDHLDTNEFPEDLPASIKAKLSWLYQHEILANRYPDGQHGRLKQAIAEYVNEGAALADSRFTPEHIAVGNGSDELIRSLLIATCVGGDGSILVAEPTFSMYRILAETLGIPVVRVNRQEADFAVNLEAAQTACDRAQPPVRVVFIVHPNSPTANPLTPAELDWLRQLPESILIVVDEAYFEFSQQTTAADVLKKPNWVVLRTFSKAFRLAAHRVGYSVSNPALTAALEKVRLPYNLPSLSQAVARLALENRQELLSAIPALLQERDLLQVELATHLIVWPSAANFIYARPKVSPEQLEASLIQLSYRFKQLGTLVRRTGGGLRFTVGAASENRHTLERLRKALAG